jgi:hypothetical protein
VSRPEALRTAAHDASLPPGDLSPARVQPLFRHDGGDLPLDAKGDDPRVAPRAPGPTDLARPTPKSPVRDVDAAATPRGELHDELAVNGVLAASGAPAPWPVPPRLPDDGCDLRRAVEAFEQSLIEQALARTGGNKLQAAKLLSLNRTTLVEKLKKYDRG